ncbi:hypothetical protein GCM10010365_51780 [Streptomyces poonensis]|uniref:Uncharacterized protein n=2 Tax=Streptomyces poonensis TaxID=68255 RepID=A0A918UPH2_9ACTN|nr:hypothetical protein GCM10010365_51780 [Streptomyces poonensis]
MAGTALPVDRWREMLERTGLVRMHDGAEAFLTEFGDLDVQISGPGITCAKTPFSFDPDNLIGEEDRFVDRSATPEFQQDSVLTERLNLQGPAHAARRAELGAQRPSR